ncbi:XrtA/PEP-CTERM system histidine kinase PrsK [Candidatus Methylomicrobium oryzae]|uniref:XrtA/PEP-CTERM system histidine kinase PrsK n=1 Tax=Candidatus Methylomicrobium oryzae TaxID=2802053 RepID=UPI001924F2B3|nr:XrtA/PEP-CTERM system histidine kinase PrsK [Methylomicrobium sp. RS1]MBL1264967.1 PEP-CTERM system histidine kinase PrsK [Methylomicrobium sp. RS1]
MESYGFYSYLTAAIAYLLLLTPLLWGLKKHPLAIPFMIPIAFSSFWAGFIAYTKQNPESFISDTLPLEALRNTAWFFLLGVLLSYQQFNRNYFLVFRSKLFYTIALWTAFVLILEIFSNFRYAIQKIINQDPRFVAHTVFSIVGLILVEQVYRNANPDQRWINKFTCLSLGALFMTDFIVYSKSLLFVRLDEPLWNSRGFINALIIPLLAISIHRYQTDSTRINLSRQIIFHTTVLFGIGLYLILMSISGFYIRNYGGNWGKIAEIIFVFLAILLLAITFLSGKAKALAKVYFSKHFIHLRYDYRDEWIRLSRAIAMLDSLGELSGFIIKTMADLVDSSGGGLWLKNAEGNFYLTEEYNLGFAPLKMIKSDQSLVQFLKTKRWVIDFVEYEHDPEIYDEVDLSQWDAKEKNIWLIIPLFRQNELEAFVVLTQARVVRRLNWEDHDLLKTAGMQLANALVLSRVSDALAKSKQFEAYNRFSAYLVHDLKNLVAQISLIIKNAEAHKHNPDFIEDAVSTLENVVNKIDHLLGQLKRGNVKGEDREVFNLVDVISNVAIQQSGNKPLLEISTNPEKVCIVGDKARMTAILGHLVQNAQDATDDSGWVRLELRKEGQQGIITIMDNGCGMDEKFIAERLFRPFDTTKGNAGMGIGVYEARDCITKHGGHFAVDSSPGKGSVFTIVLPLAELSA